MTNQTSNVTAFLGTSKVATGDLPTVALQLLESGNDQALIFDDRSADRIELDLRGSCEEVLARLSCPPEAPPPVKAGRGRPKLGVVAREITLLPRHWQWLAAQPGGASVALRKLVEDARRTQGDAQTPRQSREAAYKFMHALAGDLPGYEEATRTLFAGNRAAFEKQIAGWPEDVNAYANQLAAGAWEVNGSADPGHGGS